VEKHQLHILQERTWQALLDFDLDNEDSRNVSRFEKLSKLYLQLAKQLDRMEKANPEEVELTV
jgi:hypothetical protein